MAQDAFLRAFRALASWRKEAAFSTWLFALATNLYRSEIRRIPVGSRPLEELIEAADLAQATKLAEGCPIFDIGGTVEVRPVMKF